MKKIVLMVLFLFSMISSATLASNSSMTNATNQTANAPDTLTVSSLTYPASSPPYIYDNSHLFLGLLLVLTLVGVIYVIISLWSDRKKVNNLN
jgi:hypothetical protein